jgi:hypothetical protein
VGGSFEFSSDQPFVWLPGATKIDDGRITGADWCEIKVTPKKNNLIRVLVSWKQSRKELSEAGATSSWSLTLEATRSVKLGEKFKLEFGDEKILGTKCRLEGVIEEVSQ